MAKNSLVPRPSEAREVLRALTTRGPGAAGKLTRVPILLPADAGATAEALAHALDAGMAAVERGRTRLVEQGREAALPARPRPGGKRKLDGRTDAFLVALAWSLSSDERPCWTRHLRADPFVDLTNSAPGSAETVRRALKKMR